MKKTLILLLASMCLAGCFRMTVKSGLPVGNAPIEYNSKWHSGIIYGMAELSGPYDLSKVCPQGWSEIQTSTSFVNGFVESLTDGIYNPQSVTIRCTVVAAR